VPRAVAGDPNNNLRVSSYYLEDGSYLRLKTLTLGYTVPKAIQDRLAAKQLRVYVSAQNLVTLTKYTGFDPETPGTGFFGRGIDNGTYPNVRTYTGGLQVNF